MGPIPQPSASPMLASIFNLNTKDPKFCKRKTTRKWQEDKKIISIFDETVSYE
jgi:hypothetical protein